MGVKKQKIGSPTKNHNKHLINSIQSPVTRQSTNPKYSVECHRKYERTECSRVTTNSHDYARRLSPVVAYSWGQETETNAEEQSPLSAINQHHNSAAA